MRGLAPIAAVAMAFLTTGCIVSIGPLAFGAGGAQRRGSPPPPAPAHGYRDHHPADGTELVYDAELGVYVAPDLPHHYYRDGWYLRFDRGSWFASTHLDGPWQPRSESALPAGLRTKHRTAPR